MPVQQNLNVAPYYDDFDPSKNYYSTLFKPGYALQARELSGLQSTITDQIEQLASKFLAPGDVVNPGEYAFIKPVAYVKIGSANGNITDYVGSTLTGVTSGVTAKVVSVVEATEDDAITFFVSYNSAGTNNTSTTFQEGETLNSDTDNQLIAVVGISGIAKPVSSPAMGSGCLFSVTNGSYYINGFMVRNYDQSIVVSKYTTNPTCQIGFIVTESFVTSNEDASLLDNSQGSSNFAAPGADRLKIELTLAKLDLEVTVPNFIRLVTVIQGNLQGSPTQTIKWDWLYDILARRTFNESGDYIVKDFSVQPMEYPNTDELDGLFNAFDDGTYPPIPDSGNVVALTYNEADANYVLNVSDGLAYVQGYEVGFESSIYKFGEKARTTQFRDNASLNITDGPFFYVSKVYGAPDVQNITSNGSAIALDPITLYGNFTDGYTGNSLISGTLIPQNLGNQPQTTYHIVCSGAVGQTGYNEIYKGGNSAVVSGNNLQIRRGDTIGNVRVLHAVRIPAISTGVIIPKYFQPVNLVGTSDFYEYNSEYKLGFTNVQYFTHLVVTLDLQPNSNWVVGSNVIGENSGATAVVEQSVIQEELGYAILVLSNVIGEFIPGEGISQGAKSAVIFKDGEISGFAFTNAGNDGEQFDTSAETSITLTSLGSSITLTVAAGDIVATNTGIVLTALGRGKVTGQTETNSTLRRLNYSVATAPNNIRGYAIIPNVNLKSSAANTKSFYSSLFGTNDFSADISGESPSHIESFIITSGGTFSGSVNDNFIISDNYSGNSSEELKFGDTVSFVDDNGLSVTKQVLFTTEPSGYGSLRTPAYIYFTTTLINNVTGKQVVRIRAKRFGNSSDNLIYELPQKVIKTLESAPSSTDIRYEAFREFYVPCSGGSTSISITTTNPNEQFIPGQNISVVIAENQTNTTPFIDGRFILPTSITTQDDGKRLIINFDSVSDSLLLKVIATVSVTNVKAKKKILAKYEFGVTDGRIFIPAVDAAKSIISLGRTDVFKLYSVVRPDGLDVTDNYTFDDGQRDNIYDISRLILKANRPAATTNLYVTCDAFDHSTDGDFFSVDSYTHGQGVSYKKIPIYSLSFSIPDQQQSAPSGIVELRDCVDFRPSVNTGNTDPSVIPGLSGVGAMDAKNFRDSTLGGNADVPKFMVPGSLLYCDIEYYLGRIDSLFLDRTGELRLTQGIPDLNPKAPSDESTSIRLYDLKLPPYTFSAEDIYIKKFNYRRYTMKDISSLDKRIQKVENYVSLSLLEQAALNTQVRDAVTGLDRFKNGFVVDSFANHSNGNTNSPEYRCAIDPNSDHLRAPHFTEQVTLEEVNQLDTQRVSNFYRKTGPFFTVPYRNVEFIKNPFATRTVNLQPFSVFTYDGEVRLDPSVDTWQEVRRRDRLVIEDNSLFNAMVDMTDNLVAMGLGSVWGDWATTSSETTAESVISFAEAQRRGLNIQDGGGSLPFSRRPVRISGATVLNQSRSESRIGVNPATSTNVQTSQGDRIVDTQIAKTMRTTAVFFSGYRLKPNAKYYAFFDGIDVNAWVSPDEPTTLPEDNSKRFVNNPNTNPKGFGQEIISDSVGTVTGVFLVPNGRSPVSGSTFNGDLDSIVYDASSTLRNFDVGTRSFRLTTNATNGTDVDAYGESGFTSSGVIIDKQETVISTRVPNIERMSTGRTQVQQIVTGAVTAEAFDPVAQTFLVDQNNPNGIFVTELDVFFKTKDNNESVLAYLVPTEGQVPTEDIIPFSLVEKHPDSILRVVVEGQLATVNLPAGTIVVGQTSGARGVMKTAVDFEGPVADPIRNNGNTVYNLILSNYLNEFVPGELIVPEVSPALPQVFRIVNDEIAISRLDVRKLGTGYTTASVNFSAPQLPGGVLPTATAVISKGMVVKIIINTFGKGYTQIPTVTISGNGTGAEAVVRVQPSRAAVNMGVAVSDDATAPTKFKFNAPVYLLGNTNYAFVLKAPNSVEYTTFISKLGENLIGTETRVTQQPLLGSIFRSQNGGLWTEDQTEDIMFTLHRAEFSVNSNATIQLENVPLGMEAMDNDPIETSSALAPDPANETNEFGNNPKIVRVYKKTHGHLPGDFAYIEDVDGYGSPSAINGIPIGEINGLHTVISADFNTYTIKVATAATSSGKAGGTRGMCNYNRQFEVLNIRTGSLLFKNTVNNISARAAGSASINGNGQTPYVLSSPVSVPGEIDYYYTNPKQCAHYLNEVKNSSNSLLQGRRSLNVTLNLLTTDDKISPVFDYDRTNAILVHSLIDRPAEDDLSNGTSTRILTFDGTAAADVIAGFTLAQNNVLTLPNGKIIVDAWNPITRKLKVRGQHVKSITPGIVIRNSLGNIIAPNVIGVSNVSYPYFIPETQQDGSVFAKWISREFKLENSSNGLEVKITGIMYENDSIRLYYNPRNEEFDGNLTDVNWIPFNGNGLCNNNNQIKVRSSDIVDPRQLSTNDWTEFTWSAQGIPQFSGFALKVVLTAGNVAKVPLLDDLRVIASE